MFVDESTNRFFNLDSHYGYFCHAAVGIPEGDYPLVAARLNPVFDRYRDIVGPRETEFKHREFRRIPHPERTVLATEISAALRDTGSLVTGFYTPTESFILERVRWNLIGEADRVPEDSERLYDVAAAELRARESGHGRASLIANLLHLPMQALISLLMEFGCTYRILYDPREKREDRDVAGMVDGYIQSTLSEQAAAVFRGMTSDRTSEQEIGLQLADLVVGEVRDFFGGNDALLRHGARDELITPWSDEPLETVIDTPRGRAKTGALTTLPADVTRPLFEEDGAGATVFNCYVDLFASGIVTGYSVTGTPRDVLIYERCAWDQADLDFLTMLLTLQDARRRQRLQS